MKVTIDLKLCDNKWILDLIDMWSRLTISVFIDRKTPQSVINTIMLHWVGAGYGVMKVGAGYGVITDNEDNSVQMKYERFRVFSMLKYVPLLHIAHFKMDMNEFMQSQTVC